ncbi:alpha/beta hydrolase family protein [Nocardioides salsibiostraticola]
MSTSHLLGVLALSTALTLSACTSGGGTGSETTPTVSPTVEEPVAPTATEPAQESVPEVAAEPTEAIPTPAPATVPPVSVPGLAEQIHRGDRLTLGAVRERVGGFTSYDVTYRSRSTTDRGEESYRISGVLNVPDGPGPFPAVVLAHGYIDPAIYVRGQGMTRERAYLASRGYIALHVDYRNHAESDDDPEAMTRLRQGYSADVINAVKALRNASRADRIPLDRDRVALFGRSMGGGVVLKALVAAPGLVQAAAPWASVSSLEAENYRQFIAPDPEDAALREEIPSPAEQPGFWRRNSSRPYFDRITEPVLMVHGRFDDTCPPEWAEATQQALVRAGVDSRLERYDDGHAFGPAFFQAMDRTIEFFDNQLGEAG